MPRVEFGRDVPCRACGGAGQRVYRLSPEEQRDRDRMNADLKRRGLPVKRGELSKPCPDCGGTGLVDYTVADHDAREEDPCQRCAVIRRDHAYIVHGHQFKEMSA